MISGGVTFLGLSGLSSFGAAALDLRLNLGASLRAKISKSVRFAVTPAMVAHPCPHVARRWFGGGSGWLGRRWLGVARGGSGWFGVARGGSGQPGSEVVRRWFGVARGRRGLGGRAGSPRRFPDLGFQMISGSEGAVQAARCRKRRIFRKQF